jgi:hypothetical protein
MMAEKVTFSVNLSIRNKYYSLQKRKNRSGSNAVIVKNDFQLEKYCVIGQYAKHRQREVYKN